MDHSEIKRLREIVRKVFIDRPNLHNFCLQDLPKLIDPRILMAERITIGYLGDMIMLRENFIEELAPSGATNGIDETGTE